MSKKWAFASLPLAMLLMVAAAGLASAATWQEVETWTDDMRTASWHEVETWTDYAKHAAYWHEVETWTNPFNSVFFIGQPALLYPENDSIIYYNTPTFYWYAGVNAAKHLFWLDNDSDFSSPSVYVQLGGTTTAYTITTPLADDNYWWKVVATGSLENSSDVWTFELLTPVGKEWYDVEIWGTHIGPPIIGPYMVSMSDVPLVTRYNSQRKLVRLSDGALYCIYFKQLAENSQIYVKKSVDNGETWTDETRISTYSGMEGYDQLYPSIAVDSSDHLHVVWVGKATGYTTNNQIWYAKYVASWAEPFRISIYAGMDANIQSIPSIAVDSNDNLHVVWDGRATGYTYYYQIWYAKYAESWAAPVRISTCPGMDEEGGQNYPSIAVDSTDNLHVVWQGYAAESTAYEIWYARYTDSWATPVSISTYAGMEGRDQEDPSIAVDSSDNVHVVWRGWASGYVTGHQIWYAKYTDSWSYPTRISTADGMYAYCQWYPSIAVDSSDYLYVIWHGRTIEYVYYDTVWYAKYETSWATPKRLQVVGVNINPNIRWSRWPVSNQVTDRIDYVFTEGTVSPRKVMFSFIPIDLQEVETWTNEIGSEVIVWQEVETWEDEIITEVGPIIPEPPSGWTALIIFVLRALSITGPLVLIGWKLTKVRDPVTGAMFSAYAIMGIMAIIILWFVVDAIELAVYAL